MFFGCFRVACEDLNDLEDAALPYLYEAKQGSHEVIHHSQSRIGALITANTALRHISMPSYHLWPFCHNLDPLQYMHIVRRIGDTAMDI